MVDMVDMVNYVPKKEAFEAEHGCPQGANLVNFMFFFWEIPSGND